MLNRVNFFLFYLTFYTLLKILHKCLFIYLYIFNCTNNKVIKFVDQKFIQFNFFVIFLFL